MAVLTIGSDFWAQENKVCHCFHLFPIYLSWSDETGCHILVFWMLSFKLAFSLSSFTFIEGPVNSSLSAIKVVSSAYSQNAVLCLVTQLSPTLSLWIVAHQAPLSMGILQARTLEWVAIPSFRGSSQIGIEPGSPALQADSAIWATSEAQDTNGKLEIVRVCN